MREMSGLKKYFRTALVGGVLVALPIFLLVNLFLWLLGWLNRSLAPISRYAVFAFDVSPWMGNLIAILVALGVCLALGAVVGTQAGHRAFTWLEAHTLHRLPGYNPIKEVVGYISRRDRNPFSRPVLVTLGDASFVGFLSDELGDRCTVFLPTGPNPTTGLVIHVHRAQLQTLEVSTATAMKTIIACGAGAQAILPPETPTRATDQAGR
jgi:uncharacterized membrane protein